MGKISDCLHLEGKLKNTIYLYVSSSPKGVHTKYLKLFLLKIFHLPPPVSTTPVVHLELRISRKVLKKFETALMGYLGVWDKLIHENLVALFLSDQLISPV